MKDTDRQIEIRVTAFVSDLTTLIRRAALEAVAVVLGAEKGGATAVFRASSASYTKRTPEQIAEVVGTVLGYIKSNPNKRSEDMRKDLNLSRPVVRDALDRLMASKQIKMKGAKRAATYT